MKVKYKKMKNVRRKLRVDFKSSKAKIIVNFLINLESQSHQIVLFFLWSLMEYNYIFPMKNKKKSKKSKKSKKTKVTQKIADQLMEKVYDKIGSI